MSEATELVKHTPAVAGPWLSSTWIQMEPNGTPFDLAHPHPSMVNLEDLVHHLSMACRFAGGVRRFYSIAEHSVLVARILADEGYGLEVQFKGLMHDAAEAYCQDLTRPLKGMVAPLYSPIEEQIMAAIGQAFDFDPGMPDAVKWADNVALFMERRDLKSPPPRPWANEDEFTAAMRPWHVEGMPPSKARDEFLTLFHRLNGARG